jgi:hypothetical protein
MKILLSSLLAMLSINAFAEGCNNPDWVFAPKMENKILILQIKGTCTLDKKGNFENLKDFYVKKVSLNSEVVQVHATNQGSMIEELKATEVDSTIDQKAEDDDMVIRYITKVGTDGHDLLVFDQDSKEMVKATGNAKFVTKLYNHISVKTSPNGVVIEMIQETRIKKPGFAPESIFVREASKGIKTGFEQALKETFQDISVNF